MNFEQPFGAEQSVAQGNEKRLETFINNLHKKYRDADFDMSDEDLLKLTREIRELEKLEFDDDNKYNEARKQLDLLEEKSPWWSEKKEILAREISSTNRGLLELNKFMIDNDLLDEEITEKDKELNIETSQELDTAKKMAGVTTRYEMLKRVLEKFKDDYVLRKKLEKEIKDEREKIIEKTRKEIMKNRKGLEYYEIIPIESDVYGVIFPGLKFKTTNSYAGYSVKFFGSKEEAEKEIKLFRKKH